MIGELETARRAFNEVDHVFKGAMEQAPSWLGNVNLLQLRLTDELGRRGVTSGYGIHDVAYWVAATSSDLYDLQTGAYSSGGGAAWAETTIYPEDRWIWNGVRSELAAIPHGHYEEGLAALIAREGLAVSVPGLGAGSSLPSRNPRYPKPRYRIEPPYVPQSEPHVSSGR